MTKNLSSFFKSTSSVAAIFVLTASVFFHPSQATEYKSVVSEKSTIGFSYKQMGVGSDGQFKKFTAQISFDPAKPQAAKASFDIDVASIDTGSDQGNDEVQGKGWFNVKAFSKASFVATQIKSTNPNQFEVTGNLTIKGQTKEIKFPMKYVQQSNMGLFTGSLTIHRVDFAIGEGSWSKFDVVANEVQINFNVTAQAVK